jgi:hypothetical protein
MNVGDQYDAVRHFQMRRLVRQLRAAVATLRDIRTLDSAVGAVDPDLEVLWIALDTERMRLEGRHDAS